MDTENAGLTDATIDLISKQIKLVPMSVPIWDNDWKRGPVHSLFTIDKMYIGQSIFMGETIDSRITPHSLYPKNGRFIFPAQVVVQREDRRYFIQEIGDQFYNLSFHHPFLPVPSLHSLTHGLDCLDYARYFPIVTAARGFPAYCDGNATRHSLIDPEWPCAAKVEPLLFWDGGFSWRVDHILVKTKHLLYYQDGSALLVDMKHWTSKFSELQKFCTQARKDYADCGE